MAADTNLRINGKRLWSSLMEMAQIGATPKGGVNRLTLTDLDGQSRDLFARGAATPAAPSRSIAWARCSRAAPAPTTPCRR